MLIKLDAPPGLVTEVTNYTSGPRYYDADWVRFRYGRPEVIGGYETYDPALPAITGEPRRLLQHNRLTAESTLTIATTCRVYNLEGGTLSDITPYRDTSNTASIDTTNTSTTVAITDTAHGASTGDVIVLSSISIGGLTLNGEYTITVTNANEFTITASAAATSTANLTNQTVNYLLQCLTTDASIGFGWGTSSWSGPFGWGSPSGSSSTILPLGIWSLDNWGEDVILAPRQGQLYYYDISAASRATLVTGTNIPSSVGLTLVTDPDRHLVAFGSQSFSGGAYDPLLIRWSTQEDYTNWNQTATTTAGEIRVQSGNSITCALKTRGTTLFWTDRAMYSLTYIGPPFIFGIQQLGADCGAWGPMSAASYQGTTYWLGCDNFYMFDGTVQLLDCPVRNHVFDDFNTLQREKTYAWVNKQFQEVWWLYCSANSNTPDRYVIYNYAERTWSFGSLSRSCMIDRGFTSSPIGLSPTGTIYLHEYGTNADGAALTPFLQGGPFELTVSDSGPLQASGNGDYMQFIRRVVPDATIPPSKTLNFDLSTHRYPNSPAITKGPYPVTQDTQKVSLRARGRQVSMRFYSSDIDNNWRLGTFRLDTQTDGLR